MPNIISNARLNRVASPGQVLEVLTHLQERSGDPTPSSLYIYDLVDQCNLCSSQPISSLLGYAPNHPLITEELGCANLIHPDDLEQVATHFQKFATLTTGQVIEVEYRMLRADGMWRWLHSQETVFVQATDGFPLQILGLIQDITDGNSLPRHLNSLPDAIQYLSDYVTASDRTRMMANVHLLLERITSLDRPEVCSHS